MEIKRPCHHLHGKEKSTMETRIDFTSGLWERKMSNQHLVFPSFEIADPFTILPRLLVGR
jgi:hypothetical protein